MRFLKYYLLEQEQKYLSSGDRDGEYFDDIVYHKKVTYNISKLKPTQREIYIGKTLGLVFHDMVGGDMKTIISKDNYIVDGHHRWAATKLHSPKVTVITTKVDLLFKKLVPVLRKIGDALGNERGLNAEIIGDKSLFDANIQDIKDAVFTGKFLNPNYYDKEKAIIWWEKTGEKTIEKRLKDIQTYKHKVFDIDRSDMPRIKPNQVEKVVQLLKKGKIDVRKGFSQ